jgi:hypothetical protein
MKNIVLAATAAVAMFAAVPASAQVPRCDYYGRCQGSTAPSGGGYDNRYNNGGGYGYNNGNPTLVDALVLSIFRPHHSKKPKNGQRFINPDCSTSWWDERNQRMVPMSPAPAGGCPRGTHLDDDELDTN